MRNRTQYLTVLQFDLCDVQGDKLDHYRKGAVPEQQMFPISYVKGCKNIHQYTPRMGELLLVVLNVAVAIIPRLKKILQQGFESRMLYNTLWSKIYLVGFQGHYG